MNPISKATDSDQEKDYECCLSEVLTGLAGQPRWEPLKVALEKRHQVVHWLTSSQIKNVNKICFKAGHACYDEADCSVDREFSAYLQQVINPLISRGELSDGSTPGSYDDRKLRLSETDMLRVIDQDGTRLTLSVGPTCYQQCQSDIQRKPLDSLRLMSLGLKNYRDPYAYFARGLGITIAPLTRDGHTFIGKRIHSNEYDGFLCFVSGWIEFSGNIISKNIFEDMARELGEEIFLTSEVGWKHTQFAGLSGNPLTGETDLVFTVRVDVDDTYFDNTNWPEHAGWMAIRNREEAEQLITRGTRGPVGPEFDLMFSSRFALDYLIHNHWSL